VIPRTHWSARTGGFFRQHGENLRRRARRRHSPQAAAAAAAGNCRHGGGAALQRRHCHGRKELPPTVSQFSPFRNGFQTHWPNYVQGKESVGETADTGDWRVARTVFVADDAAVAEAYGRSDARSPYRFYYSKMLTKMSRIGRLELFKSRPDQPDDDITLDHVLDELVITGTTGFRRPTARHVPRADRRVSASWSTPASTGSTRISRAGRWS